MVGGGGGAVVGGGGGAVVGGGGGTGGRSGWIGSVLPSVGAGVVGILEVVAAAVVVAAPVEVTKSSEY